MFLLGCQVATHRPGSRRSSGVSGLPSRERLCGRTSPSTRFQPTRSRDGQREGHSPRHENDAALGREWFCCDAQTGMPSAEASGAICVQRFDDSRNSAIHITYRISLRSSSMQEPRYPLLRVVMFLAFASTCARERPPSTQGFQSRICFRIGGKNGGTLRRTLPSGLQAPDPRRVHDEGEQAVAQIPAQASRTPPSVARREGSEAEPRLAARRPQGPLPADYQPATSWSTSCNTGPAVPRDTALRGFGARLTGRPEHDVSMILPQVHLRNGEGICVFCRFCFFALPVSRKARLHLKPSPASPCIRARARQGPIAV